MRTIVALLLLAGTAHAFGTSLPCDGLAHRQLRQLGAPRAWVGAYCCRSLTYDGPDLVWVETCFAVARNGRVLCASDAVLNRDFSTRKVGFDGCSVYP